MTPTELKAAREALGFSAAKFAPIIGATDGAHVRKWERTSVPPPVQILVQAMLDSQAVRDHFGLTLEAGRE